MPQELNGFGNMVKDKLNFVFDGTTVKTNGNSKWKPKHLDFNLNAPPVTIWRNV